MEKITNDYLLMQLSQPFKDNAERLLDNGTCRYPFEDSKSEEMLQSCRDSLKDFRAVSHLLKNYLQTGDIKYYNLYLELFKTL